MHYILVSLSHFKHYFHHNVRGAAAGTAVAHVLSRKRIAQWVRNCRNYATKHRNAPARTQGRGEPRHGRRVSTVLSGIEALKSIIRTVSWQHSVANERTPLLQGSHSGGLRPTFICCPYIALCYANWLL